MNSRITRKNRSRDTKQRRPAKSTPVNSTIALPRSPGSWVDEERCTCGATYAQFRAYPDWQEACATIRTANGGFTGGGGFRSRGPVLHVMRVMKLLAWYQEHYFCAHLIHNTCSSDSNHCYTCEAICPWCEQR